MPRRRLLAAGWIVAGGLLVGVTTVPLGRLFLIVVAALMAGLGLAAGFSHYMLHVNMMARVPAARRSQGYAEAGIIAIASYIDLGGILPSVCGWKEVAVVLAIGYVVMGLVSAFWRGMPPAQRGAPVTAAELRSKALELRAFVATMGGTYFAWELLYLLPAALGARRVVQAFLGATAQTVALSQMVATGKRADRNPRRVAVVGGVLIAVGIAVVAVAGGARDAIRVLEALHLHVPVAARWVLAAVGFAAAEYGSGAVSNTVGGETSRQSDPIRSQLILFIGRYGPAGIAAALLTGLASALALWFDPTLSTVILAGLLGGLVGAYVTVTAARSLRRA